MIIDTDQNILERTHEELYSPKYVDEVILQLTDKAYTSLIDRSCSENKPNPYEIVRVFFKLSFERPLSLVHPELRRQKGFYTYDIDGYQNTVSEFICSVSFYAYEYQEMLDSMKPGASLKLSAYKALNLNPIVEKTKNNFTIKARNFGIQIDNIRDVRFTLSEIPVDSGNEYIKKFIQYDN